MKILFITLFSLLFSFIETYYIVSIDSINNTEASSYIQTGRLNPVQYTINPAEPVNLKNPNDSATIGSYFNIGMLTESYSAAINNLEISDKNKTLKIGTDYNIIVDQDNSHVLPSDIINRTVYYGGLGSTNNNISNNSLNCYYSYGELNFNNYTNNKLWPNLTKILTVGGINFAKGNNTKGLTLIKAAKNGDFIYSSLDDNLATSPFQFHDLNISVVGPLNNVTVSDFWIYNGYYISGANLIVMANDSSFYIYNLTGDGGNIFFYKHTTPLNIVNDTIAQVGVYSNSLVIAYNNSGLVLFSEANNTWIYKQYTQYNNITLPFNDMIINYKTAYLIVPNYGMLIFDFTNETFTLGLNHPYLTCFDYTVDPSSDEYSTYFIGIIIRSNKDFYISEFLLELIVDPDDEYNPKMNKVFISDVYSNMDYIGTDLYGYSYFFNKQTEEIIVIIRSQQNYLNGYSYVLDISDQLPNTSNINKIFIMSNNLHFTANLVFIYNDNSTVGITSFQEYPATLSCNITKDSDYRLFFTSYQECSKPINNHLRYLACPINYYVSIDVDDNDDEDSNASNLSALWAILAILLVGVIAVIIFVVCCKTVCVKGKNKPYNNKHEMYVISEAKDKDKIDVQVDIK